MNFNLNATLGLNYKNSSQKIRVMSEAWVAQNIFCPVCGNEHIYKLPNNAPVADFRCANCGESFELKSKNSKIGNKITDGAFSTMLDRINSTSNPDLFIMQYSRNLEVINLTLVPKFFFVPSIIEKRKPLSDSARRSGWTGCNILYSNIPEQGKIEIIKNQKVENIESIVRRYAKVRELQTNNIDSLDFSNPCEFLDALNNLNSENMPEIILLDVGLPQKNGIETLKILKQRQTTKHIPVILLTAKNSEIDKVHGLNAGADDYITKPFGVLELLARINAVLRRSGKKNTMEYNFHEISLNTKTRVASVESMPLSLTFKEFELLTLFLSNPNLVFTREQLLDTIWGSDFQTRTVDVHINTLRSKLGKCGKYIQTVRGVGYKIG